MSPEVTPGADRVIRFSVNGHEFGFRRPTRADIRDAYRRLTTKMSVMGLPGEAALLDELDGKSLLWEARLEVGLFPTAKGTSIGESAPTHWLETVYDQKGDEVGRFVSFRQVDPDEFGAVVAHLEGELGKKKAPPLVSSSSSAEAPSSA